MIELDANTIHLWIDDLNLSTEEISERKLLLSPDELERAMQFRSTIHQERFIASKSSLRLILSHYLLYSAEEIRFSQNEHKKPLLLESNPNRVTFNISHSDNKAVYAIGRDMDIGIDIEQIQLDDKQAIAKRFFNAQENSALDALPDHERANAFYTIWTRKEAVLKAIGTGLYTPLASFSVSAQPKPEILNLKNEQWYLFSLNLDPAYTAAVASNKPIQTLQFWKLQHRQPYLEKIDRLNPQ